MALAAATARAAGERELTLGANEHDVILAVMREARTNWMRPTEDEAFVAAVAALPHVLPARRDLIQAETRALGDRNKVMAALVAGVPVDLEAAAADLTPFPDGMLDLVRLWDESR